MRILLVLPSQYCMQHGRHDRSRVKIGRMANLSLLQVAALIPTEHEIELVDDHFEEPDYEGNYDWIGLTCMTPQAPRAYEIAARFRARGIPVVMGGYHATLAPEHAESHVDALVMGEAEKVMPDLLADLERGTLKRRYQAEGFADMTAIPVPRYDLLAKKGYRYMAWPVQATRGCPLKCHFCSVTTFFKRTYRKQPPDRVAECIKAIPSRNILFVDDDLFVAGRSYILALADAIRPLGISWYTQTDIKSADNDDILAAARSSGCRSVFIGVEAFNQESLAAIHKERTNRREDYARVFDRIHRHGMSITAAFIMGLDHDRPDLYPEIIQFLAECRIEEIYVNMVIPLPGTPMATELKTEGRITDLDFNHYDGTHQLIAHPNYGPGEMEEVYWRIQREYYALGSIFRRFFPLWPNRSVSRQMGMLGYNLLVFRHWIRRRVAPYVANAFPPWLAAALWLRAEILSRVFGQVDATPMIDLERDESRLTRQTA